MTYINNDWSVRTTFAVIGGVGLTALVPAGGLLALSAQTAYPDVPEDYWAQPFIEELSKANIVTGYPDGLFRPEQAIERDEYAAIIRQAFDTQTVRSIPQASQFEDVPQNYWASAAIEEAYESGFMDTPESNQFEPKTDVSRVAAVVALVQGLDMESPVVAVPAAARTVQPVRRRRSANQLVFPLASTAIMQLFAPPAQAQVPPVADGSFDLDQYYVDADQIPAAAKDEVALATQAGIVVNYPEDRQFNPDEAISRSETAALVYRALVYKNELPPSIADVAEE